jgi:hypothetical protein
VIFWDQSNLPALGKEQRGGAVRNAMISGFKALHCLKISRILASYWRFSNQMFHVRTLKDIFPHPPPADEPCADTGIALAKDEAAIPTTPKRLANPDPAVRNQNFDLVRTEELRFMPFFSLSKAPDLRHHEISMQEVVSPVEEAQSYIVS